MGEIAALRGAFGHGFSGLLREGSGVIHLLDGYYTAAGVGCQVKLRTERRQKPGDGRQETLSSPEIGCQVVF